MTSRLSRLRLSSSRIRFPLRTKVLLPVAAMIVLTFGLALLTINRVVHREVLQEVSGDLEARIRAFDHLQEGRLRLLAQSARVVADIPFIKAAMETQHAGTVQRVADQLAGTIADSVLLILDPAGELLAYAGSAHLQPARLEFEQLIGGKLIDGARVGLIEYPRGYLQAAAFPVVVPDGRLGPQPLGTVILAYPVDAPMLAFLDDMIGSRIVFFANNTPAQHSTGLNATVAANALALFSTAGTNAAPIQRLDDDPTEYLVGLSSVRTSPGSGYLMLAPFGTIFQDIVAPIEETIILLGVFALGVAILISLYLSREIVRPIQQLVSATDAVSQGDYAHEIRIAAQDEIGFLARKFDLMRRSLQRQMNELASRNTELEETLEILEQTQKELVQSEKLAATGRITAQLSHELNNPIHNVRACLESALAKLPSGGKTEEYLQLAHEEVVRMGRLVRQMLDFYRPPPQDKRPVQLNQLLENALRMLQPRLDQGRIDVEKHLPENLPEIRAAADQIKQVVLNLLLNAIDAMPQGGRLTVETSSSDAHVELSCADTGGGIPEEALPNIFDAFYTTKSQASGVGLGLSVSYGIVKNHQGRILVESSSERGTVFRVSLPLALENGAIPGPDPLNEEKEA